MTIKENRTLIPGLKIFKGSDSANYVGPRQANLQSVPGAVPSGKTSPGP